MRLEKLDLNLLVALDVLLQERGVSLAADRLFLSQSATSGVLARLRDYFNDDLLVLRGRSMVLTPQAEKLIDPVRAVLVQIRETILVPESFTSKTSDRLWQARRRSRATGRCETP
jgi:LysR family transcriptional regulator, nod-box dependent transcriptional activator